MKVFYEPAKVFLEKLNQGWYLLEELTEKFRLFRTPHRGGLWTLPIFLSIFSFISSSSRWNDHFSFQVFLPNEEFFFDSFEWFCNLIIAFWYKLKMNILLYEYIICIIYLYMIADPHNRCIEENVIKK